MQHECQFARFEHGAVVQIEFTSRRKAFSGRGRSNQKRNLGPTGVCDAFFLSFFSPHTPHHVSTIHPGTTHRHRSVSDRVGRRLADLRRGPRFQQVLGESPGRFGCHVLIGAVTEPNSALRGVCCSQSDPPGPPPCAPVLLTWAEQSRAEPRRAVFDTHAESAHAGARNADDACAPKMHVKLDQSQRRCFRS